MGNFKEKKKIATCTAEIAIIHNVKVRTNVISPPPHQVNLLALSIRVSSKVPSEFASNRVKRLVELKCFDVQCR